MRIGMTERGDGGLDQSWRSALSRGLVEVIKHWESRVSYLDMYSHTRRRLEKVGVEIPSGLYNGLHADFETRCKIGEKIAKITLGEFEICGEPGLPCTGCVSKIDLDAMGIDKAPSGSISNQRKSCLCLAEKTELLYKREQCSHKCAYCYWR